MTIYTQQASNVRRTWFLIGLFLVVVIGLGWFISQAYQEPLILYVAVAFSLIMNFVSYWYSDKIVLKLSGARPANRQEFFDLYTVTENLAIAAGLPMPKIYVVNDPSPNAFATGRDKNHAVVAVTTGLLSLLNRTELEGVIAHELSHIGNRDILLSTVVVVLVGFVAIVSDLFIRSRLSGFGGRDGNSRSNGILILVGVIFAVMAPLAARLIQLAISRRREFLADASGALLTRYPEGLASALRKISANPIPLKRASGATAHLYISNPLKNNGRRIAKLFMTHPPAEERIAALEKMAS